MVLLGRKADSIGFERRSAATQTLARVGAVVPQKPPLAATPIKRIGNADSGRKEYPDAVTIATIGKL